MTKKIILKTLLFGLLLGIFMIVNLPASWIYTTFIEEKIKSHPIQVKIPEGTIWRGHSAVATQPNLPIAAYIPQIKWSLEYQHILSLKLIYKIEFNHVEAVGKKLGSYYILLGVDFDGIILQLKDNNAALSIEAVGDFSTKPALIKGQIKPQKNDPELRKLLRTNSKIKANGNFQYPIPFFTY